MIKVILALAWPTMLEQLLSTAVQYIDTAMVGSLGTEATAAVGSTSTVNWLVGSTVSALGVGFLSSIAKSFGEGDENKARRIAAQAVFTVLIAGTVITAVTLSVSSAVPVWMKVDESIRELASTYFFILYLPMIFRTASTIFGTVLRASGDTASPMKVGIFVNLLNIILNYFLIYETRTVLIGSHSVTLHGAGLGVIGAAVASAVAYAIGGIMITVILLRHPRISPIGISLRPDKNILLPCMKITLPNLLQRFGTSFGYVVFASMINSIGFVATAAHTVANTVESAFYIPGYGMQTAAATLAGNAHGAGDEKEMKLLARMFIPIEIFLMIISGALLFIFAPPLMSIFSDNPEVIKTGSLVLRMVALSEPFYGFSIIIEGMMMGMGKTKLPFIFNVSCMWLIRIVGTFVAIKFLAGTLISAWACMILHNLTLFVIYLAVYRKGLLNISLSASEKS